VGSDNTKREGNRVNQIENAKEIHCVNSSFADLMDSFDLSKVSRLCIHEYARVDDPVNYKHNFEIITNI
jgi:hypothetical protein